MDTLPPLPCYLNGEFTELPKAKISVMDRGFIFGDGVYEVAPVYAGQLFRFDQHMARLERSLAELRIANPLSKAQWTAIAQQLITGYAKSTGEREQDIDHFNPGAHDLERAPDGLRCDVIGCFLDPYIFIVIARELPFIIDRLAERAP